MSSLDDYPREECGRGERALRQLASRTLRARLAPYEDADEPLLAWGQAHPHGWDLLLRADDDLVTDLADVLKHFARGHERDRVALLDAQLVAYRILGGIGGRPLAAQLVPEPGTDCAACRAEGITS